MAAICNQQMQRLTAVSSYARLLKFRCVVIRNKFGSKTKEGHSGETKGQGVAQNYLLSKEIKVKVSSKSSVFLVLYHF